MKFEWTGIDEDRYLRGEATNDVGPEDRICLRYRSIARDLFESDAVRMHPIFLEPWPFAEPAAPRRRIYDAGGDEQPVLYDSVMDLCSGRSQDADLVVALPPTMRNAFFTNATMAMIVIMDIAAWHADNAPQIEGLLWADSHLKRAAIASRLLYAAENGGMLNAKEVVQGYDTICASVLEAISSNYDENGEALLMRNNPGLVTLIHRTVESARGGAINSLPLDPAEEAALALDALQTLAEQIASRSPAPR